MELENLNELSTDESSGGGEKTDEDVVDYVVSAIHTRFIKKKKNQVQREEKKSRLESRILVDKKNEFVNQISEESLYEQMENFADLLRVTISLYDAREKLQHVFLYL
jgi:hypothetical protein